MHWYWSIVPVAYTPQPLLRTTNKKCEKNIHQYQSTKKELHNQSDKTFKTMIDKCYLVQVNVAHSKSVTNATRQHIYMLIGHRNNIQVKLHRPKQSASSVTYWLTQYHLEHLLRPVKTAPVKMELWLTMLSSELMWMLVLLVQLSLPSPPALPPPDWPLLFELVGLLRRWWILHSWISPDDIGIVISCVGVCVCVFTHHTRRINWDGDGWWRRKRKELKRKNCYCYSDKWARFVGRWCVYW